MKKLLTIAMVAFAAVAAKADTFLYWTADVGAFNTATTAQLYGIDSEGALSLIETVLLGTNGAMQPSNANLGVNASPYTNYLVTLYSGKLDELQEMAVSEYALARPEALAAALWSNSVAGSQPATSPFTFSGFTASIPEPSSALMLLLGLGALALKRKIA